MKKEVDKPQNQEDADEADGDIEDEITCEPGDDNASPFRDEGLTADEQLSRQLISLQNVARKSRNEPLEAFVKSKINETPENQKGVSKTQTLVVSPEGNLEKEKDVLKKEEKKKDAKPLQPICTKNAMAKPLEEIKKNAVAEKVKEDPVKVEKQKKNESSLENAKKLEKLKQKIKKSDMSKRPAIGKKSIGGRSRSGDRNGSEAKKRRKRKIKAVEENKKRTIGDKIRNQFQAVRSLFSGTTAGKVEKTAQAKVSKKNARLGNVADGDDILPQIGVKERDIDDCWIEDPAVLTDRTRRPDLVLVPNNNNGGNLWHENVRPFWRNKAFQKEVPPIPPEKTVSKMLLDVINNKTPIAEPASDPSPFFNPLLPTDALALKDDVWFREKQILGNTIRSIVRAVNDSEGTVRKDSDSQAAEKSKLTFKEPDTHISYYRHDNTKRETLPFVKSMPGTKPRKLKKTNTPSTSSSISTSTSGSSASSPADATRLTEQNVNKKPKDGSKIQEQQERSGIKKVPAKKK